MILDVMMPRKNGFEVCSRCVSAQTPYCRDADTDADGQGQGKPR